MKLLVTGGAGYIGSFMSKRLIDDGHEVTIIDSLERGNKEVLDIRAKFELGDLKDLNFLSRVFSENFDAIIHFAGYISMEESTKNPYTYFNNNTFGTLNILEAYKKSANKRLIFSSTAGVYGNPIKTPIPEDHPKNPTNPYGESKYIVERILDWYQKIYNISFVSLRYFNACGAAIDGSMGEDHKPETHIIPLALDAAKNNKVFKLFGTDYNTPDKTAVRDYIHVLDLVEAHVLALNKITKDEGGFFYNIGTGKGHSNKEVVDMVKKISGKEINIEYAGRRPGDAQELVADVSKIKQDLNFNPKYSDLETIIKSAWLWHSKN